MTLELELLGINRIPWGWEVIGCEVSGPGARSPALQEFTGRGRGASWTSLICASGGASGVGGEVGGVLDAFQASSYCRTIHTITRQSSPSPSGLRAGTCTCQAWKPAARTPEQGCVSSPPCSLLVFTSGLFTRGSGGQDHEGLLAAANAFQTGGLRIPDGSVRTGRALRN